MKQHRENKVWGWETHKAMGQPHDISAARVKWRWSVNGYSVSSSVWAQYARWLTQLLMKWLKQTTKKIVTSKLYGSTHDKNKDSSPEILK